jgi:hypothetical protein
MECGHAANSESHHGLPACAICAPDVRAYTVSRESIDLTGRVARCGCGEERPSELSREGRLAFFEYRGPGSREARERCAVCAYYECAHDPEHLDKLAHGRDGKRRPTVVESGKCTGFQAHGPFDHDRYYCGCRGWD